MMVPSQRLLVLAGAVVLPATTVAGLVPSLRGLCWLMVAVCVALATVDAVLGTERLRKVAVSLPEFLRFTKNVAARVPVTIENHTGGAIPVRIGVQMPLGVEAEKVVEAVDAPPGRSVLEWECTPRDRGDLQLREVHVECASPVGLWQVREARAVRFQFRVYPNLRDRATASLFLKTADPGLRLRRQVGKGREFDNLRQYMPGDSFEDVHWKATARRAYPVVKLYRVEHAQEVYAVIDHSRLSAREGMLESYVGAALHLALVAEKQGDRFGLMTFSDRTQKFVRARNGMDHFRLCRETIYNLRAERVSPDFREVFTNLQLQLRRRALIIFFTSLDDALLAETFERDVPLLARRHLVLVNVTGTAGMKQLFKEAPADLDAAYAGLAGQLLWNRMRTLEIALQNRGVKLTIVTPERIKTQVTAGYLEVKRRQSL